MLENKSGNSKYTDRIDLFKGLLERLGIDRIEVLIMDRELSRVYKKRWSIEVYFQALKARGFRLEESRLRSIEKYKKLFAVVSMAYTLCWAIGKEDGRKNPVRPKKHGYPQYSVFRRGLNIFRAFCKRGKCQIVQKTIILAINRAWP